MHPYLRELVELDLTVGRSWAYGEFSIDELIDTAKNIDGAP
jgi:hypothetical protein